MKVKYISIFFDKFLKEQVIAKRLISFNNKKGFNNWLLFAQKKLKIKNKRQIRVITSLV